MILSSSYHEVKIDTDDDCWSNEKNNTIEKIHATLVKFSNNSCSVHINNPWLSDRQNGFGIFLSREMDCSSTVTIDCLPDNIKNNSIQLTCHTSDKQIQIPCSSISLNFKRNIKKQETKKLTSVQVVALAKGPCIDDHILFQCPKDYQDSCIDENLRCNGRSECPNGGDERDCHPTRSAGIPIIVIILIVLAFLVFICILSTVLICCCCRAAFNGIIRRFRSKKGQKGDITITGEDAGLMKGLAAPETIVEIPRQQQTEPTSLIIDSTKPIYPRLE